MKYIFKIGEFCVIIIVVVLLIINGSFAYSKYIKKDPIANVFGWTYMIVKSNSMAPEFSYGHKLIVKLNTSYKVGDIITYKSDNVFVTHRVVLINEDTVITKGDANNVEDSPIKKDMIVGVVKKILK